ncbi:hypothetical protein [Candidatus Nitrotoga sp. AM1P]|uniref:hypothetical protein n=1 Tax=Candidatus Nitrotoga sp. AM1P TaxID=2559597 RepID=UPI001567168E|nr:hypothetical protein [Candidatus Nitrotoga sp. AM1P]
MTNNLDQNNELEKQQLSQDTDDQIKFSGESRRRFAISGLAVSGIILTLASRPALGDPYCKSPSGFLSGNTSQHGACPPPPPSKFVTNPDETFIAAFPKSSQSNTSYNNKRLSDMLTIPWPEPQLAKVTAPVQQVEKGKLGAASYMTAFRASSGSNSSVQKGKGTNNITMPTSTTSTSVVAPQNPDPEIQKLLQHLVKALQNARSGATPYLTEDTIRSMFYEWQDRGVFSPTANVDWDASKIIYYLEQNSK